MSVFVPDEDHRTRHHGEIAGQFRASIPGNRTRWARLLVATVTVSPGPPMRAAWAARIASASRLWSAAVGRPRRRTFAQNSEALRITAVVIGSYKRLIVRASNR